MSNQTTIKSLKCPEGTSGLAVEPWSQGEIYAVVADWSQAAAPVYAWGSEGWHQTGKQAADYSHRAFTALREEIEASLVASGDWWDDEELTQIINKAQRIGLG